MTEQTDLRELRERLEEDAKEWQYHLETFPGDRNNNTLTACDSIAGTTELLTRAAAALERLETLEAAGRMALSALDGLLGDSDLPDDDRPGTMAMRALSAALPAPAPAPQQGGEP